MVTRKEEKAEQKRQLDMYRGTQRMLCVDRDHASCVICWFRDGVKTRYQDIHHIYGRGKKVGDWREHYTNLMCVCRKCHPLPAQDKGSKQSWVIEIAEEMMNATPINPAFEHVT